MGIQDFCARRISLFLFFCSSPQHLNFLLLTHNATSHHSPQGYNTTGNEMNQIIPRHLNHKYVKSMSTEFYMCVCVCVCMYTHKLNRMGKTRDLFRKIRDTRGNFHAKMSTIKDRNGMDLTEAEDIKKRWQEYT